MFIDLRPSRVLSLFSQITSGNCGLRRVSLVLSHAQSELQAWLMNTYINLYYI